MRLSKFVGYVTFLLLAVVTGFTALQLNHQAKASLFGVPGQYIAYYNGQTYTADDERFVFFDGIPLNWQTTLTTSDMFINAVHDYLYNQGTNAAWHQQEGGDARASAIINTMMGVQSNDPRYDIDPNVPRWQNGVTLAKSLFDTWASIVRQYDAKTIPGASVDWNYTLTSTTAETNGTGIAICNTTTCNEGTDRGTSRQEVPDIYFLHADNETQPAMVFHHPNGTTYTIKKWCGNLTGDETPFPQNWTHQPLITYATPPGTFIPPATLNFNGAAQNIGTGLSNGGILFAFMKVDGGTPTQLGKWQFGPLAPGASTAQYPFGYAVGANAPAGQRFEFYTQVIPATPDGSPAESGHLTYTVGYARSPGVQGFNGDIHAGGGLCGGQLYTGSVTGNSNSTSMGQYVVAASGIVGSFGSNGSSGSSALTQNAYSQACRPDLLQAADNGRQASDPTLGDVVDLGAITGPGKPDLYYYDGQHLQLSGTAHSKVTIVATTGRIEITGPILLDAQPFPSRMAPSVGIISQDFIAIDPIVTRVDAYLFSNSYIDTCAGVTPNSTICTTPQLVVNGFLMAKDINFNRVGALNTSGAQVSEKIVLTPQLYLNPPRFFEASKDDGVLQAQGEKQPLF